MSSATLLVYAAAAEGVRVAASDHPSLCVGVGKAAAAAMTMQALVERAPRRVVLFGVCGAYPGGPAVGDLCVVAEELFGDEGTETPKGFWDLEQLGLASEAPFRADPEDVRRFAATLGGPIVRGLTVSTCSGTDGLARARLERFGADVETMEGAAVALACARRGVSWVELRCVSNRTGDRDRAGWDLERATATIQEAVLRIADAGWA